mmetsp:Transcript_25617/g.59669  ORF Transcript_25617/g.59669 Transcript_25617/m.59669 type:complete len:142 (-) Transcript_25617:94-519(-)
MSRAVINAAVLLGLLSATAPVGAVRPEESSRSHDAMMEKLEERMAKLEERLAVAEGRLGAVEATSSNITGRAADAQEQSVSEESSGKNCCVCATKDFNPSNGNCGSDWEPTSACGARPSCNSCPAGFTGKDRYPSGYKSPC